MTHLTKDKRLIPSIKTSAFVKVGAKQVKLQLQTYIFLSTKKGILLLLALMLLSGCLSISPTSSPPPERTLVPIAKEQTPVRTFGIIYPMAHPFYEMITELAERVAKPHGIQLIVKAPDEINLEQQIRMMETMIKQKVSGIAIDPIDPEALTPAINKAVQAGIPVICFESDAPGSNRLTFIGADPFQEGIRMGEMLSLHLKSKGMILIESGTAKMNLFSRRLEGLLHYVKHQTEIQVLETRYNEGLSEQALKDLEGMIDEHPHFDALVNLDIISSSASILFWKATGLNRSVLAIGLTPEVKEALINGQMVSVLSENEQQWGTLLIDHLLMAAEGKPLPSWIDTGMTERTAKDTDG